MLTQAHFSNAQQSTSELWLVILNMTQLYKCYRYDRLCGKKVTY